METSLSLRAGSWRDVVTCHTWGGSSITLAALIRLPRQPQPQDPQGVVFSVNFFWCGGQSHVLEPDHFFPLPLTPDKNRVLTCSGADLVVVQVDVVSAGDGQVLALLSALAALLLLRLPLLWEHNGTGSPWLDRCRTTTQLDQNTEPEPNWIQSDRQIQTLTGPALNTDSGLNLGFYLFLLFLVRTTQQPWRMFKTGSGRTPHFL